MKGYEFVRKEFPKYKGSLYTSQGLKKFFPCPKCHRELSATIYISDDHAVFDCSLCERKFGVREGALKGEYVKTDL